MDELKLKISFELIIDNKQYDALIVLATNAGFGDVKSMRSRERVDAIKRYLTYYGKNAMDKVSDILNEKEQG